MINRLSLLACLFYLPVFSMAPSDLIDRDEYFYAEERKNFFYATAQERLKIKKDLDKPVIKGESTTLIEYFGSNDLDVPFVKQLLQAGATPQESDLVEISLFPGFESIKELLNCGVDPNAMYERYTSLYRLCCDCKNPKKTIEVVKLLLSKKANPNIYNGYAYTTPLKCLFSFYLPEKELIPVRKQLIHELIFHGAHLITNKNDRLLPCELVKDSDDPNLMDLAKYAEKKYVFRMLQLLKKKNALNIMNLPKDILQYIADRC